MPENPGGQLQLNPLLRSVHLNRECSHTCLIISEGVKYNKKLMTNKYVCVNDQTCSAKIYVLFFAKFFFFRYFHGPKPIQGQ